MGWGENTIAASRLKANYLQADLRQCHTPSTFAAPTHLFHRRLEEWLKPNIRASDYLKVTVKPMRKLAWRRLAHAKSMNRFSKNLLSGSLDYNRSFKQQLSQADPGYLYLIQCNEFTKIGIAKNVERRFLSLSTSCPYPIRLLRQIHCGNATELESQLHKMFHHFRVRGEWFRFPQDILDCLLSIPDSDFKDIPNF